MAATAFDNLHLPKRMPTRSLPIKTLMPMNVGLNNFFAVMTQAYLVHDDSNSIGRFDELFSMTGLKKTESNLSKIRKKGMIYEGEKSFPSQLVQVFRKVSWHSEYVHIRSNESGKIWKRKTIDFFEAEDFFSLIDEDIGEFHVTDAQNNWYCVIRDDEPIVFFAVNDKLSKQLTTCAQESSVVMSLSPNFNCN